MFSVIHANHIEDLRDVVLNLMRETPLSPLDNETLLVQSNGMAQWMRMAIAESAGVAASLDFPLPSSFVWQAYRAVLGDSLPKASPFDRAALVWRLMRLLPPLLDDPVFAPLAHYLKRYEDDATTALQRRYHLAEHLAALFDQYLIYRPDWINTWAREETQHTAIALEPDQRWQPALWRVLLNDVAPEARAFHRARVHERFCTEAAALTSRPDGLPPRVFIFGISTLPYQVVQALKAISSVVDVVLLVTNPCQYYWADALSEREALRRETQAIARARHAPHPTLDLLDRDLLHLQANPLLTGWGGQGRDFLALLYEFEDQLQIDSDHDLFRDWADSPEAPLLTQLQQDILELEHPRARLEQEGALRILDPADDSLRFTSAHSPLREVEILRDQLLDAFERDASLKPRDIVVLVPEIDRYTPMIEAVFGQFDPRDPRYIPYSVADRQASQADPLLNCILHLLALPERRLSVSELLDWLDIPAFRRRFGIGASALIRITQWVTGSGVRWGLNRTHRALLGLPALHDNTWRFGLERMLLGYAVGDEADGAGPAFDAIEPFDEVQGLDAELVGKLLDITVALEAFTDEMQQDATPEQWSECLSRLFEHMLLPVDPDEFDTLSRVTRALNGWLDQCRQGDFDMPVALCVVREALRQAIDEAGLPPRFLAGRVNFATLMPMRAIPFRYTYLLGMNDEDYPRTRPPQDFDLMARHPRLGDRSRRNDDRYLMLEALLATRERFTCSWVGQDQRGNGERSPSVLISELRDAIAQGWRLPEDDADTLSPEAGERVLAHLTAVHPLQPFSRRYFDGTHPALFTYDDHWEQAHAVASAPVTSLADDVDVPDSALSATALLQLLRAPMTLCAVERLGIRYRMPEAFDEDTEPFALDGRAQFSFKQHLLAQGCAGVPLQEAAFRHQRAGQLPVLGFGRALLDKTLPRLEAQLSQWQALQAPLTPRPAETLRYDWQDPQGHARRFEATLDGLTADAEGQLYWWSLEATHFGTIKADRDGRLTSIGKPHRLLRAELNVVLWSLATQQPVQAGLVFEDRTLLMPPITPTQAADQLARWLLLAWEGWQRPLPTLPRLAFDYLAQVIPPASESKADDEAIMHALSILYDEGGFDRAPLKVEQPMLGELWPSFSLMQDAGFAATSRALYGTFFERLTAMVTGDASP